MLAGLRIIYLIEQRCIDLMIAPRLNNCSKSPPILRNEQEYTHKLCTVSPVVILVLVVEYNITDNNLDICKVGDFLVMRYMLKTEFFF